MKLKREPICCVYPDAMSKEDIIVNLQQSMQKQLLTIDKTLVLSKDAVITEYNVAMRRDKNILTQRWFMHCDFTLILTDDGYVLEDI